MFNYLNEIVFKYNKYWLKTIPNESKGQISLGSGSLGLQVLKI